MKRTPFKKHRSFPHGAIQLFLGCIVALLFGAVVVPRWIPKPVYEGVCLTSLPAEGELVVYDFSACPIGYMAVDGVSPISSFRQGWIDERFAPMVDGPDYVQYAFSGSVGTAMYTDRTSNGPVLAVYLDPEMNAYLVKAASLDVEVYTEDSSLTACYGKTQEVICIGVLKQDYWYLPEPWKTYNRVWVAWLQR